MPESGGNGEQQTSAPHPGLLPEGGKRIDRADNSTIATVSPPPTKAKEEIQIGGVTVASKVQAVIVDPDVDLSRFRQLPDTDRGDPEFFMKHRNGEKAPSYVLFMRRRFPFWKAVVSRTNDTSCIVRDGTSMFQ